MVLVILEDTWEANDIKAYCTVNEYPYVELSVDELYKYDSAKFLTSWYFCNTDIVQYHINKVFTQNSHEIIPDTYENDYSEFYCREIKKIKFGEITQDMMPIFVKPITNDKVFDGQVLYDLDTFLGTLPKPDDIVYTSTVLKIISEYRLLIGNHKMYGIGKMCGADLGDTIPENFINALVNKTESFRCIDIGYEWKLKKWIVIEINPAFSLDDYNIPLSNYMEFCIDSCQYLMC